MRASLITVLLDSTFHCFKFNFCSGSKVANLQHRYPSCSKCLLFVEQIMRPLKWYSRVSIQDSVHPTPRLALCLSAHFLSSPDVSYLFFPPQALRFAISIVFFLLLAMLFHLVFMFLSLLDKNTVFSVKYKVSPNVKTKTGICHLRLANSVSGSLSCEMNVVIATSLKVKKLML